MPGCLPLVPLLTYGLAALLLITIAALLYMLRRVEKNNSLMVQRLEALQIRALEHVEGAEIKEETSSDSP